VRFKSICRQEIDRLSSPPSKSRYIQKVIELEGGNEYREGATEALRRLKAPKAGEDEWEDIYHISKWFSTACRPPC